MAPVELTRMMLERIAEMDGELKSYATVTTERAMDAARKAEDDSTGASQLTAGC